MKGVNGVFHLAASKHIGIAEKQMANNPSSIASVTGGNQFASERICKGMQKYKVSQMEIMLPNQ
jgi:FlaA1/EpsC-like NDP-sugar epimerase